MWRLKPEVPYRKCTLPMPWARLCPGQEKGSHPGKPPREYQEYGTDTLEIHRDAVEPGQWVLVVDDLLATGVLIAATIDKVEKPAAKSLLGVFDRVDLHPW